MPVPEASEHLKERDGDPRCGMEANPYVLGAFLNEDPGFSVMMSTAQVQLVDYS